MKPYSGLFFIAFVLGMATLVYAEADTHTHNVTITVPQALSISSSQEALDFSFSDHTPGAETSTLNVIYNIIANSMSQADGATAVLAQLDQKFSGIDFKAEFGAFVSTGGNTELAASSAGYVTVEDAPTPIAHKTNSVGKGSVLKGNFPVAYKAVATEDLPHGNSTQQLTITLTDI